MALFPRSCISLQDVLGQDICEARWQCKFWMHAIVGINCESRALLTATSGLVPEISLPTFSFAFLVLNGNQIH